MALPSHFLFFHGLSIHALPLSLPIQVHFRHLSIAVNGFVHAFVPVWFPKADVLVKYLEDYQKKLGINVQFNTEVKNIVRLPPDMQTRNGTTFFMQDQYGNPLGCRWEFIVPTLIFVRGLAKFLAHLPWPTWISKRTQTTVAQFPSGVLRDFGDVLSPPATSFLTQWMGLNLFSIKKFIIRVSSFVYIDRFPIKTIYSQAIFSFCVRLSLQLFSCIIV